MNKNDEISREHFDDAQIKEEHQIRAQFQSDLTPNPSGKVFLQEFKAIYNNSLLNKSLPYMDSISLNKDIILYRAMMVALSYILGKISGQSPKAEKNIVRFMSSDPMISLRDNSFASNEHENTSRKQCLRFLKLVTK